MTTINQTGNNAQATGGNNSPIINNKNKISITVKQKTSWFLSGLVLPIAVALITEFIKQGKVSEIISLFLALFG